MSGAVRPTRVVIDTDLLVSALVFGQGRLAPLRLAWQHGRITPLVSRATAAELIRVLGYPKFKLSADERQELLADYLPDCTTVRAVASLPQEIAGACRDPFDLPFLELALAGKAAALLTGDRDLLELADRFDFAIVGAETFLGSLG